MAMTTFPSLIGHESNIPILPIPPGGFPFLTLSLLVQSLAVATAVDLEIFSILFE